MRTHNDKLELAVIVSIVLHGILIGLLVLGSFFTPRMLSPAGGSGGDTDTLAAVMVDTAQVATQYNQLVAQREKQEEQEKAQALLQQQAQEQARLLAQQREQEQKRQAEQRRQQEERERQQELAKQALLKKQEEARKQAEAEALRLKAEAEAKRLAAEAKQAEEARRVEEIRKAEQAEREKQKALEQQLAAEARAKAEQAEREKQKALEQQLAAEARAKAEQAEREAKEKQAKEQAEQLAKEKAEQEAKRKAEQIAKTKAEAKAKAEQQAKRNRALDDFLNGGEIANGNKNQIGSQGAGGTKGIAQGSKNANIYAAQIRAVLKPKFSYPNIGNKFCVVQVYIDVNGNVINYRKKSGDNDVCASALSALAQTAKLPKPPTDIYQQIQSNGFPITFDAKFK